MMDDEIFEKGEILVLKDCREHLMQKLTLTAKHLEHVIDLVEIHILCAAADASEFGQLKACRETLLEIAAERRDVTVILFPSPYLLEDANEAVH